jgi:hypothetical protein
LLPTTPTLVVLERVGRQVDFPKVIQVDRGSEFVSRDLWTYHVT